MRKRSRKRRASSPPASMAEAEVAEDNEKRQGWSTGEELLLACAVKRHGFKDWDSVAMELKRRTSRLSLLLTPQNCQRKYADLHRRFTSSGDSDFRSGQLRSLSIPWLDELRRLRVAELRREVHRSDVSILSLQLKVKKLKEEKEMSSRGTEKPDLAADSKAPSNYAGKVVSGDAPDPVKHSSDGAFSVEKPDDGSENDTRNGDSGRTGLEKPVQSGSGSEHPVSVERDLEEEDSDKGSCNSQADKAGKPEAYGGDSRDAAAEEVEVEMMEGQRVEDAVKESSDVQSSVSLTRMKRRRRRRLVNGDAAATLSSGGDAERNGGASPADTGKGSDSVEAEPLDALLRIIRTHEHSSLLEHPLECQEKSYKSMVRQHVDLQTVERRLQEGYYSSTHQFSRDLLLLFTNCIVFFPKSSHQAVAALELRRLVVNYEFGKQTPPSCSEDKPLTPLPQQDPESPEPKPIKPVVLDTLLANHKVSLPIIACRKRSSFSAAKSSTSTDSAKVDSQNSDKKLALDEISDAKPSTKSSCDEQEGDLKTAKMKPATTGIRSSRRNKANTLSTSTKKQNASPTSSATAETKRTPVSQKLKKVADEWLDAAKKRGAAADFLKRIKLNQDRSSTRSDPSVRDGRQGKASLNGSNNTKGGRKKGGPVHSGGGKQQNNDEKSKGKQINRQKGKQINDEKTSKHIVKKPTREAADLSAAKRKRPSDDGNSEVTPNRRRKRART